MQQCMERTATNRPKAWPESKPKGREKVWERSVGILYEVLRVYKYGPMAQLVRAPPCHGGGRGFKSRLGR